MTKLSKTTSPCTVIVRRKSTFKDAIQSVLSYVRAFEESYAVCFVDVRISHIMEDIPSSNLSARNYGATSIRYIRVRKMKIRYQVVILLLGQLG